MLPLLADGSGSGARGWRESWNRRLDALATELARGRRARRARLGRSTDRGSGKTDDHDSSATNRTDDHGSGATNRTDDHGSGATNRTNRTNCIDRTDDRGSGDTDRDHSEGERP